MLVGTVSIEKSEALSRFLADRGVEHRVLNARYHEEEASIVAQAGVPGAVTIATNMAGRGTDIQLGGNLEMMLEEKLTDDMSDFEREQKTEEIKADIALMSKFGWEEGEQIENRFMTKSIETSQKRVETRNFDIRKNLLKYDDVMNDQRKTIFEQRMEFMTDDDVSDVIEDFRHQLVEDLVEKHVPKRAYAEQWDIAGLNQSVKNALLMELPLQAWADEEGIADEELEKRIREATDTIYTQMTQDVNAEDLARVETNSFASH